MFRFLYMGSTFSSCDIVDSLHMASAHAHVHFNTICSGVHESSDKLKYSVQRYT